MSKILDYTDRSTCVLFGDGAGAVLIKAADNMYRQINYTRGDTDVLVCRGIGAQDAYVKMNGNAVFRFAVDVLKQGIDEILKKSDMTLDDIDYIVCHQANERIINQELPKALVNQLQLLRQILLKAMERRVIKNTVIHQRQVSQ